MGESGAPGDSRLRHGRRTAFGRLSDRGPKVDDVLIEVIHIDECPNWRTAGAALEDAARELGISDPIRYRLITDRDEVATTTFSGSPTILIDGRDQFPVEEPLSELACRVFSTPDGLRGVPTHDQLVAVLRRAADD